MKTAALLIVGLIGSSSGMANVCEQAFLRDYYKATVNVSLVSKVDYLKNLDIFYERALNAKTLEEKMGYLGEQYSTLAKLSKSRMEYMKKRIADQKASFEQGKEMEKLAQEDVIHEYKVYSDRMIEQAAGYFQEAGIPVLIKARKYGDAPGETYKYLELDASIKPESSAAAKKIHRYMERFGTKNVTFDFVQNIRIGSAGFSQASIKRIDLGFSGMKNLILDDVVTMVGKHEFHHAAFAAKRVKGVSSIYHVQFHAMGKKALSEVDSGYNRFMSAEELYNWANNSFWASERIMNIRKFKPKDFLADLSGIGRFLNGTQKIGQQSKEISESFAAGFERMRAQLEKGELEVVFFNEQLKYAKSVDEAFHIGVGDPETEFGLIEYLGVEYRESVAKIFEARKANQVKYTQAQQLKGEDLKALKKELIAEENKVVKAEIEQILSILERNNTTLGKVADAVTKESAVTIAKTEAFIKKVKESLELDKNTLQNPEWEEEFRALAREYRRLGNIVKEDYKGFAGN